MPAWTRRRSIPRSTSAGYSSARSARSFGGMECGASGCPGSMAPRVSQPPTSSWNCATGCCPIFTLAPGWPTTPEFPWCGECTWSIRSKNLPTATGTSTCSARNLLVAPISEPGYGKPVLKDIYLPDGEDWFDYFTGEIYKGGQVVNYQCPLDRMPLFVRAGSILPMAPDMNYSEQKPVDPLIVDVYAGKAASFQLYEDDGTSLAYRQDAYAWTPLSYTPEAGGVHQIEIGPSKGQFKGQVTSRRYEVRVHGLLKPEAREGGWSEAGGKGS